MGDTNQPAAPAASTKPALVRVRVTPLPTGQGKRHVYEGQIYKTGDVFETTAARAKEFGDQVELVS